MGEDTCLLVGCFLCSTMPKRANWILLSLMSAGQRATQLSSIHSGLVSSIGVSFVKCKFIVGRNWEGPTD